MIFIDSKYLSPLSDVISMVELFERTTSGGKPYIAAKVGFLLYGIIMPYDAINETFVKVIERMGHECRLAFEKKERERVESINNEPQQQAIKIEGCPVDPVTGEILEDEISVEEGHQNDGG